MKPIKSVRLLAVPASVRLTAARLQKLIKYWKIRPTYIGLAIIIGLISLYLLQSRATIHANPQSISLSVTSNQASSAQAYTYTNPVVTSPSSGNFLMQFVGSGANVTTPITGDTVHYTIRYTSDRQIDLSWTPSSNVTSVMIRAKYGGYPVDSTDGYLVYSGTGTSCSDTNMDLQNNFGMRLYYRAWGYHSDGSLATDNKLPEQESRAMIIIIAGALALGLTIATFCLRRVVTYPGLAATFAWLVLTGISWINQTTPGPTDPYFYLFLFALAMTITMPIATWELRQHERQSSLDEDEERTYQRRQHMIVRDDDTLSAADKLRIKHGMGRSMIRQRRDNDTRNGW